MRHLLPMWLAMVLVPSGAPVAWAQENAAFIVTYVEVVPAAKNDAAALLRTFGDATRREAGVVRFELLQRIDRPHHFAVLEVWSDQKARDAHAGAAHVKRLREGLQPLLAAPYDERPHGGLAIGTSGAAAGVVAVTHVDFIPPRKDEGIAALLALVEPSRKETGNIRFDVLQQTSRPNHLTLVEAWSDQAALEAHAAAAHTRAFRDKLLPMSGSLFDERLYAVLK